MNSTRDLSSFEDLIEHADWVRSLAYGLVRDPARADDLVQEAWVAALKSPPRHDSNLKAWLGAVVTRLAQSEWRSEGRRRHRERQAAKTEALPATDQLVHEAQLSSELVEAVVKMEEPYKTVLLMRYFRNRKPAAIARELGRPLATIKTQLQRGLERLRKDLDGSYGDRRSWCLALLPLARGGAPSVPALALAPAIWLTPLLIVLGLCAATVLWPTGSAPRPDALIVETPDASQAPATEPRFVGLPAVEERPSSKPSSIEPAAPVTLATEAIEGSSTLRQPSSISCKGDCSTWVASPGQVSSCAGSTAAP